MDSFRTKCALSSSSGIIVVGEQEDERTNANRPCWGADGSDLFLVVVISLPRALRCHDKKIAILKR